jgi:hypothetical protein
MPNVSDYKTLDIKTIGLSMTGGEISVAVLRTEFGDGYGAAVRVGNRFGLRRWKFHAAVLPDLSEYTIGYVTGYDEDENPIEEMLTWFEYFYQFFLDRCENDEPFLVQDYRTTKTWMVKFAETKFSYEQFCADLFSVGIEVKQFRVANLSPSPFGDGSINSG